VTAVREQATLVAQRLRDADARGLNATLHWSEENLAAEVARVEALRQAGADLPLAGMPIALKDNLVTTDAPTTCASQILKGYRSPYDATVVTRLRQAGAIIAAKANLDEFAMGSSTEHSAFGRVRHPTHPDRVPGGSSGGSAALVAAGVVPAALGSETGGSVRQPASFCGIVGVKPTYGRVSRYGLVAFGSSLDCVSVFGRTVDDAARVLAVIAGPDAQDATTVAAPAMRREATPGSLNGVRIGLPAEYFPADLHPGVRAGVDRAAEALRALGAELVPVSLPHASFAVPTYYVLAPAEAASNLARYDGVRYGVRRIGDAGDLPALYRATRGEGFGAEVRRRILVGTYVLSAGYYDSYYQKAQQVRNLIAHDFTKAFEPGGVNFLLTPTTPTPAFRAGEKTEDPVSMYLADVFVSAVSLAGLPAMSLPAGLSEGLPVGVQIIAPAFAESRMLALASALEAALDAGREVR
jgi:aspartyl-tRNA(Asn)/glutamyl-tRNA(Gln) amidotransferase subunit A